VKSHFPLRDDLIIMNAANLCPAPYPVTETVARLTRSIDGDASFQNRAQFTALQETARAALARFAGADADEIAIIRNTSEGNNMVVNGLDLGPGDDVLLWDENHPTNATAWDVKAQRDGCTVHRVSTPPAPNDANELIGPFERAMTPRTRVVAFSHVSNVSGIRLPAREICELARSRGARTLVDGAQSFGAIPIDLHAMGCDFFTASSHKWFLGPKEAGVLYVRRAAIDGLWASNVGVGWSRALEHGAQKFDNLGQRDDATVAAMGTTTEYHETLGPSRIRERIVALVSALRDRLSDAVPGIRFNPDVPGELSAGVLIFVLPRGDVATNYERLYREHAIALAPRGEGIRLSPHIYNTMEDVGRVVEAVRQLG
jgi:selenocysteine lyase/cysteine desulfurase